MSQPKTHTLDVPGAVVHYDIRSNDASPEPVLLLIGSPMSATGFGTLAGHFTDRTVVTYDPRGAGRSKRTDGSLQSTTEEHADELHRLIVALDTGLVDIFASSGGALNALALVAKHPELVRTLVAHEPPAAQELPDREQVLATWEAIHKTYQREGFGPAMAKFIVLVSYEGPIPAGFADQPGPNPASFGLSTEDDGPGRPTRRAEHAFDSRIPARFRRAARSTHVLDSAPGPVPGELDTGGPGIPGRHRGSTRRRRPAG